MKFEKIILSLLFLITITETYCENVETGNVVPSQIFDSGMATSLSTMNIKTTAYLDTWLLLRPATEDLCNKALAIKTVSEMNEFIKTGKFNSCKLVKGEKNIDILQEFGITEAESDDLAIIAVADITSSSPQITWASCVTGCDDSLEIAVNGKVVHKITNRQEPFQAGTILRLELNPGSNLVCFILRNKTGKMGFTLRPQRNFIQAALESLASTPAFLGTQFILDRTKFKYKSLVTINAGRINLALELKDLSDKKIWSGPADDLKEALQDVDKIPDGIYTISSRTAKVTIRNTICIGEPAGIIDRLKKELAGMNGMPSPVMNNVQGLYRRIDILLKPENRKEDDPNWQAKIANYLESLHLISNALRNGTNAEKILTGFRIRTFKSSIDDQLLTYQYSYPDKIDVKNPPPLIIIAPTPVAGQRPFHETPVMAAHLAAQTIARTANNLGAAVLWIGYRNKSGAPVMELTHFEEVMNDFESVFEFDKKRVTLAGTCGGAASAALYLANWPDRFAGVAIHNAAIDPAMNASYTNFGQYADIEIFKQWKKRFNTMNQLLITARNGPPFFIYADSGSEAEVQMSRFLSEQLQSVGGKVTFEERPSRYGREKEWTVLFQWCVDQRRSDEPSNAKQFAISGYSGVGPIARCFTGSFIIVVGTNGSDKDKAINKEAGELMRTTWISTNFAPCKVSLDIDLQESDYKTNNLILIGNSETNIIWQRLSKHFKCQLTNEGVSIDNRKWNGAFIGIQSIEQHPDAQGRLIALIGCADVKEMRFRNLNLCAEGWFDYAIWSFDKRTRVLDAGYYKDTTLAF